MDFCRTEMDECTQFWRLWNSAVFLGNYAPLNLMKHGAANIWNIRLLEYGIYTGGVLYILYIYIYIGIYIYIWNTYQGVFGPFLHRLRLCIVALLKARYQKFLATFALKCSSWSPVNRGTSQRAPCATIGCQLYSSVRSSNMMACRCLWDDCFQCFHFEWIQEVDLFVYIESKSQNI